VLFVSHNLQAVRAFCSRAILLDAGRVVLDGTVEEVTNRYLRSTEQVGDLMEVNLRDRSNRATGEVRFRSVDVQDANGRARWTFAAGEDVTLRVGFEVVRSVADLFLGISLLDAASQTIVTTIKTPIAETQALSGQAGTIVLTLPKLSLRPGTYTLYMLLWDSAGARVYDVIDRNVDLPMLFIESDDVDMYRREGYFTLDYRVSIERQAAPHSVSAGL
jgi:lipopolysaccharide transport system ATP-binding protein